MDLILQDIFRVTPYYMMSNRHYHTLNHVQACLMALDHFPLGAHQGFLCTRALIYHDVIYDIFAPPGQNEARSAEEVLMVSSSAKEVKALILSTASNYIPVQPLIVSQYLEFVIHDCDWWIFGTSWDHYRGAYVSQIYREFTAVSSDVKTWDRRRLAFLRSIPSPIFKTGIGQQLWEKRAQENVAREITVREGL